MNYQPWHPLEYNNMNKYGTPSKISNLLTVSILCCARTTRKSPTLYKGEPVIAWLSRLLGKMLSVLCARMCVYLGLDGLSFRKWDKESS